LGKRHASIDIDGAREMATPVPERKICRFGLYEADLIAGRLAKQGIPIKLQEQPFRILALLIERAGEMVTREELRSLLWPEGTYVEFDGSLNTALMKLRAALNDDPDNPRFIETVPRRGYRFIAPVQFGGSREGVGSSAAEAEQKIRVGMEEDKESAGRQGIAKTSAVRPAVRLRRRVFEASLLAALVVATVLLWRNWPQTEPRVLRVTALTHTGTVAPDSKVVTDGTRVYFVSERGGQRILMQTSIQGGTVEKVATPFENTVVLDISPDHAHLLIAPFVHGQEAMPVWVWPSHGGAPHRLGDVVAREAVWSPEGNLIAFDEGNKLFSVKPDGTQVRELATLTSAPYCLVWSPDGKTLRFTLSNPEKATDEIWQISALGSGLHTLLERAEETHEVAGVWAKHGEYFLFTAGSDSHVTVALDTVSNIWALRERGELFGPTRAKAFEITHGPVSFTQLAAAPEGMRVFALGTHPEYQLVRYDATTHKSTRLLEDAGATTVAYSPDEQWIVYALRQNGTLWKSRKDGTGRVELTSTPPGAFAPSWSPDGKKILFTAFLLGKQPQLYLVPSEGGAPRPVLPRGMTGATHSGDWSPDSRRIVMDYSEPGGKGNSYLQILDITNGSITKLNGTEGLWQPRWAPDGKHMAAVDQHSHRIIVSDENGGDWTYLATAKNPREIYWSSDSKWLYFQDLGDPEQSVFRVGVGKDNSKAEKILGFGAWLESGAAQCRFTGLGPHGSLYATIDHGGTDLYALDLRQP
jgi:Tol biopolymer transport system component/DNA-binding winged helix-turn-helix (wHTH) protein